MTGVQTCALPISSELKPFFLDHTLLVASIHTDLILACRNSDARIVDWREGKEIFESITFVESGKQKRLPVCPDALFQLDNGRKRLAFVLEADRGTTTHRTFKDKLTAYCHFLERGRQQQAYGVSWLRIVTFVLSERRAAGLSRLADEHVPSRLRKYFLFASEAYYLESGRNLLGEVFRARIGERRVSLF